jgi:hypothetical protein
VIRHERFEIMLAWREELSLPDQVRLYGHLRACVACKNTAQLYAENRARLRPLAMTRPPPGLREAILDAVAETHHAIKTYAPLAAPFAILPLTLAAGALIAGFGPRGFLGVLVLFCAYALFAVWKAKQREPLAEHELMHSRGGPWLQLAQVCAKDVVGIVIGTVLALFLYWLCVKLAAIFPS